MHIHIHTHLHVHTYFKGETSSTVPTASHSRGKVPKTGSLVQRLQALMIFIASGSQCMTSLYGLLTRSKVLLKVLPNFNIGGCG